MLFDISAEMRARMQELEGIDARDRLDGTPRAQRLRQIPPATGRFLAILAATQREGLIVEIGTSAGYSTMWLSLAARATGRTVRTFEVLPDKVALARETFEKAGLRGLVELTQGDAREYLGAIGRIGFCFLDLEKALYPDCYNLVVPQLPPGGLLVADNAVSHAAELSGFLSEVAADRRVDSAVVPVGKGLLIARRAAEGSG